MYVRSFDPSLSKALKLHLFGSGLRSLSGLSVLILHQIDGAKNIVLFLHYTLACGDNSCFILYNKVIRFLTFLPNIARSTCWRSL